MATIKKAQTGKNVPKGKVESEMFPGKYIPKSKSNYETGKSIGRPTPSAPKKKMKDGGSLGMKSVKAGYDNNPGVTRADVIVAAKGKAKSGKKIAKAQSGCKACWGSKMKKK